MFKKDYIMDEIDNITRFLFKLVKKPDIDNIKMDEQDNLQEDNFLSYQLNKFLSEKKINEAEDYLFEIIEETPDRAYLGPALDFYEALKKLSEEELQACGFSREEIRDGLSALSKIYVGV